MEKERNVWRPLHDNAHYLPCEEAGNIALKYNTIYLSSHDEGQTCNLLSLFVFICMLHYVTLIPDKHILDPTFLAAMQVIIKT